MNNLTTGRSYKSFAENFQQKNHSLTTDKRQNYFQQILRPKNQLMYSISKRNLRSQKQEKKQKNYYISPKTVERYSYF